MKYVSTYPYFKDEDIDWIVDRYRNILAGNGMLSMSKYVHDFETEFARYIGVKYAVATSSCTGALEIALRTVELSSGEVIIPTNTFIADATAIIREGGIPVFADIDPETYCLSLKDLKRRISSKTKAIILVHMAGLITPDIFEIKKLCDENNIILIEDASHAHGASIDGHKAGSIGEMACFSFGPTKIMTTGEGGALLTNHVDYYKKANCYRHRGLDIESPIEVYSRIGSNHRLGEINALLGIRQLEHLDEFIKYRNSIAQIYNNKFKKIESDKQVYLIKVPHNVIHSYWRYTLKLDKKFDRGRVCEEMGKRGISIVWPYEPPIHLQPVFTKMYGNQEGMLPVSEDALKQHICLPVHLKIGIHDAEYIADSLIDTLQNEFCLKNSKG